MAMYLVECYSDENLLRGLGVEGRLIRRMRGKGNVVKYLTQKVGHPHLALLDRDRNEAQPKDLNIFKQTDSAHGVTLYTWRQHRLIMLDDDLEDWIVRAVQKAGKRMSDFNLPDEIRALHAIEPKVGDPRFGKVVSFLDEARSPAVLTLRSFLVR